LRRAQRVFSRREKASARRLRAKHKVTLVHRHTANQRKDFLHKLTTGLVVKYDGICIEDLSVKGLVRTKLGSPSSPSVLPPRLPAAPAALNWKGLWALSFRFPPAPMSPTCCWRAPGASTFALLVGTLQHTRPDHRQPLVAVQMAKLGTKSALALLPHQAQAVVGGVGQVLAGAEVALGGLDAGMAQQQLDLLEPADCSDRARPCGADASRGD
jgi:hypothetical protein